MDMIDELKSAADIQEWLTRHEGLRWIAQSSLNLRAFYWGLYSGLGLNETEKTRGKSVLVKMLADTMSMKPADDPFQLSELHTCIESLRNQLHRRIETNDQGATQDLARAEPDIEHDVAAQSTEILFKSLLDSVQSLDEKSAYHRNFVRLGLEQAATASPSEALKTLDSLESSFRILTVGDCTAA